MTYHFYLPIIRTIKRRYKDVKVCVLIADLPEFMSTDNSILTRLNRFIGGQKPASGEHYGLVDGYILLSEEMRNYVRYSRFL